MMLMMVLMLVAMALFVIVVMMLVVVLVLVAVAFFVMVTMMLMMVLMLVVMMMTAHRTRLLRQMLQLMVQGVTMLHSRENLLTAQLVPRGGNHGSIRILFTNQCHYRIQLFLGNAIGTAEHNATGMLQLIVIEFTKVFGVNLALSSVRHSCKAIQLHIVGFHLFHGFDDIAELADTRRLDQNTSGPILLQHLLQRGLKIAHQATTNAAGIHFVHLNAGLFHKAAVDTDLAKLILDQHQFFTGISLGDQLLDQRCFACTQKTGKHINFRHICTSLHQICFSITRFVAEFNHNRTNKAFFHHSDSSNSPNNFDT